MRMSASSVAATLILVCAVASLPAVADPTVTLRGNPIDLAAVDRDTDLKNAGCDRYASDKDTLSPRQRAEAARDYLACVEQVVAELQILAPASHRGLVHTLGESWIADGDDRVARTEARAEFLGLNWGLGFGYSVGFEDHVEEATLINDEILVIKDRTEQPRAVFEFHFYPWCRGSDSTKEGDRGCGLFIALAASPDKLLSGVGFGFIHGWRSKNPIKKEGFSVGIGVILDDDIRTLAGGFEEGEPLPEGATEIVYDERARWSALLYMTRTF